MKASNRCYAFEVWVSGRPEFGRVINERTAGRAKRSYLLDLNESWPDYKFTDLRARKIGGPHTTERFIDNAVYRGTPDVRCGQRVKVGLGRGVIVGHNESANFDILFDDDSPKYAGLTLNVHPGEVQYDCEDCRSSLFDLDDDNDWQVLPGWSTVSALMRPQIDKAYVSGKVPNGIAGLLSGPKDER